MIELLVCCDFTRVNQEQIRRLLSESSQSFFDPGADCLFIVYRPKILGKPSQHNLGLVSVFARMTNDCNTVFIYAFWSFLVLCDPFNHVSNREFIMAALNLENQDRHRNARQTTKRTSSSSFSAVFCAWVMIFLSSAQRNLRIFPIELDASQSYQSPIHRSMPTYPLLQIEHQYGENKP